MSELEQLKTQLAESLKREQTLVEILDDLMKSTWVLRENYTNPGEEIFFDDVCEWVDTHLEDLNKTIFSVAQLPEVERFMRYDQ